MVGDGYGTRQGDRHSGVDTDAVWATVMLALLEYEKWCITGVRGVILALLLFFLPLSSNLQAQEVLLPLQCALPSVQPSPKVSAAVSLPFFDDFATGVLDPLLWQDAVASVTFDVSPLAPTIGAATLDALNADGMLYPAASPALFTADTLTSLPVRLEDLEAGDSVVLSFYYLPGGGYGNLWERVGDCPNAQDSLFLDLYSPADSQWVTVWSTPGICVDTLMARTGSGWQYVVLPLTDSRWFDSMFRFRFRNYASLDDTPKAGRAGNCDFWHLDYILLDRGRDTASVPSFRDMAFAAPAPSMLHDYRTMPYNHYCAADMAQSLDMTITNLYFSPLASHYSFTVEDSLGNELFRYDGGFENAPPYLPGGNYQTVTAHATPTIDYTFPSMTAPTAYHVVHTVREGTGGDMHPTNDTVCYHQCFGHHYAYDDGSAENGYGITSTASRIYLAYRFNLGITDTLTAVDIFFNRTLDDGNVAIPFYLTVWSVGDSGRPDEVLYRDETRRFAEGGHFSRYVLESPIVLGGSVFIGFEQSGNDYLNIGYDRSFNSAENLWYLTGTEWQRSILSGSLMLRPGFGNAATLGVEGCEAADGSKKWTVYPNPVSDIVYIEGLPFGTTVHLYDIQGHRLFTTENFPLNVSNLPAGLVLLQAVTPQGEAYTAKLIIKH